MVHWGRQKKRCKIVLPWFKNQLRTNGLSLGKEGWWDLVELKDVEVEGVGEDHDEEAEEGQVEHEPGHQEPPPPGPQPMAGQPHKQHI